MEVSTILTICINYQNDEETSTFVRGLLRQEGDLAQTVMVVDNTMPPRADGLLRRMSEEDERICILYPERNLGYFGGAAWALRTYASQSGLPEWTIVCNTDMHLGQRDFLSNLSKLHSVSTHAVVAPAIFSELSRRDLNPHMKTRPSRLRMRSYKLLFRYYPIASSYHALAFAKAFLLRKYRSLCSIVAARITSGAEDDLKTLQPQEIYAPHGSFIAFSRRYFESGGNLDHGAFLSGEELFVAETARRLGLRVVYDPRLMVIHCEHATFARYTSRQLLTFLREATDYITDTFFREVTTAP